ncbi:Uncharacterized protein FWK35_00018301 [Aphis craccivora]|uniref:Uncharacterized protein n=1 Tax=Aphis craccivora TaxID=307492 RepID=A0A6G0ZFT8_APHCR|nr:Uncharacterized protein FWK35_00018301 [Aphis craccivora]
MFIKDSKKKKSIGMGMIKTSFFVLLSTLFIVNRHTAHLCLQLGSYTGMMFIPAITEYQLILYKNWKMALHDFEKHSVNFLFTANEIRHQQHTFRDIRHPKCQKQDIYRDGLISSRPMYRDTVLFDGNVYTKMELNTTSTYSLAMTRVCATADIKEEKSTSWLSCKFPIASSRVLTTMFHMPIWINKQFILMVTSEALIHAACFVLFMSIKGMSSGSEDIYRSSDYLYRRLLWFIHRSRVGSFVARKVVKGVPLYSVGLALMANGLIGFFGYYKSLQNIVLVSVFPVRTFNNVCGHILLVRGTYIFVCSLLGSYNWRYAKYNTSRKIDMVYYWILNKIYRVKRII